VATLQVRMLHANMRRLVRDRGFDEAMFGVPINQVDLARTWMDFTVTALQAEEDMGYGLTSREQAVLYQYWWMIAHLLGVDPLMIEGVSSNEQARRVDEQYRAVSGPLVSESVALAKATIGSMAQLPRARSRIPLPIGISVMSTLARRFHGAAIADELQLPQNLLLDKALTVAIGHIRVRRAKLRADPERWVAARLRNLANARTRIAESPSPYETHISSRNTVSATQ